MKFVEFLPYYSDLRAGGLLACAYAASAASLAAVFLCSRMAGIPLSFDRAAAFSMLASGALWLSPLLPFMEKGCSNWALLAMLFAALPAMKVSCALKWRGTLALWGAFAAAQFSLYLFVINNF